MGDGEITEPQYVCVYVPEFPAQALARLRPEMAQIPIVVLTGDPPFEQVCSLNMRASRLGVARGMTRAELDSFAGLCVRRSSEAEERVAKAALLEATGLFTPRIEVQSVPKSSFAMVLDMTGTSRMFGVITRAVQSIANCLKAMHFHAQLGASSNFYAALCVAPSARKAAVVIPAGHEAKYLTGLPLAALNLLPAQADTLTLWGLDTLGQLADLPEVELVVRLGQQGKRLRLLARGEHPHLMVPEEPVFTLEEFVAFDTAVEILDSLLFVMGPMLDQLLSRAQNRAFALASVTVKLGIEGGAEHTRTIKPALPVMQKEVLLKLLHLDLQTHPPSAGVVSVLLHAEPGDRNKVQLGLFAPQLPESSRLDVTLARIAALVGEKRVGRAKLLDAHKAEGFTVERFVAPATASRPALRSGATACLRRCRPPVLLSVSHEGKRLSLFTFKGKKYKVQEAYGPWRKSGNWWSSDVWSQEEWDVCARSGSDDVLVCVVIHDLVLRQWQMGALYD